MTYDALDRTSTQKDMWGLLLTYSYDAVSNRTTVQDSLGGTTTSVYDAADRLTSRQFGGSGQTPLREDLTYTDRDQPRKASSTAVQVSPRVPAMRPLAACWRGTGPARRCRWSS